MVSLHLICAAAAFLAPAGRQPLPQRRVLLLAAKKKGKGKEAFVPYEISGDSVPMFPLPERRDAIQAHKKFGDKGVSPSKLAPGALDAYSPNLDLAFPGLRVLHLDPPVLTVDGFFSEAECDAYRALEHATETGDAHMLAQSATFSGASDARTSTTWPRSTPTALAGLPYSTLRIARLRSGGRRRSSPIGRWLGACAARRCVRSDPASRRVRSVGALG